MRADDLEALQRAALKRDGGAAVLRWLARRLGARAVLLDASGTPARPGAPPDVLEVVHAAAADIERVLSGDAAAVSVSGPSWWARAVSTGGVGSPVLFVAAAGRDRGLSAADGALIGHAAGLLRLCAAAGQHAAAVSGIREAVLHLLMTGQVDPARRVAGAMKPDLASTLRVCLVEGPAARLRAIAARCEIACGGQAWIVRCPVYRRHLIILCPADGTAAGDEQVPAALRAACPDATVGVGGAVALRDAAAGYEQAYHALAVARHRDDGFARFAAAGGLADVLGPGAAQWARQALAPLLDYQPPRPQDPDGPELLRTLRSWLGFRSAAWRALHIHRNTLSGRLRLIEAILGRDLSRMGDQAEVHLALQLLHLPGTGGAPGAARLEDLLAAPGARQWAELTLAPLAGEQDREILDAVRAWVAADARAEAAAAELGVGARWLRELLGRAESRIGRSLAGGPSARYEVLLALRVLGGKAPGG